MVVGVKCLFAYWRGLALSFFKRKKKLCATIGWSAKSLPASGRYDGIKTIEGWSAEADKKTPAKSGQVVQAKRNEGRGFLSAGDKIKT